MASDVQKETTSKYTNSLKTNTRDIERKFAVSIAPYSNVKCSDFLPLY